MGYSIIFETKVVKLKDGRLLHLSLSGCNNDTEGRSRDEFVGTIYSKEDFIKYAKGFMEGSKPMRESDGFDLKIGSRYCTMYDYGKHLLRMMERAATWEELNFGRYVYAMRHDGVNVFMDGKTKTMSSEEFDKFYLEHIYDDKKIRYAVLRTKLTSEEEIVKALDEDKPMAFYVGRKSR